MYQIVKNGDLIAIVEEPNYIKLHSNGCFVKAAKEDAQGVAVRGVPFNLVGRNKMSGVSESVSVVAADCGEYILGSYLAQKKNMAAVSFAKMLLKDTALTADQAISVIELYDTWSTGAYNAGDIRSANYGGFQQLWKCRQAHDTDTYPDITPSGSAWRTFWIPFHGTTPETAQPWVAPTMAEDAYKAGEYMIWTDGRTYLCVRDTNFSPAEYGQDWQMCEG